MCGIVGFFGNKNSFLLNRMTNAIAHRGPDQNIKIENGKINIGFRRLSINDLKTGDQPFFNNEKKIGVFCNGEIYNHIELRVELQKKNYKFNTKSDCEVILHGYIEYGLDFIKKINGMFFILIWEEKTEKLILIRDRLGVKPCYYTFINDEFFFSSEIKALLENNKLNKQINYSSIDFYLSSRYVPSSHNLLKNIETLPQGNVLEIGRNLKKQTKYWNYNSMTNQNVDFKEILQKSVDLRMAADVKLGIFLSGGLDSSIITSLMSKKNKKFEIFTHSFNKDLDESSFAINLCKELDLKNINIIDIKKNDIFNLNKIIYSMESPIANSDIIGLDLLCKSAKMKQTKVILSGEGSDEIFGSYIHHNLIYKFDTIKQIINRLGLNKTLSIIVNYLPKDFYNFFFNYGSYKINDELIKNFGNYISETDQMKSYFNLISLFNDEDKNNLYSKEFKFLVNKNINVFENNKFSESMAQNILDFEIRNWLTSYHLIKEDKISMSHSIEMRFPFLDHNIYEFMNMSKNKKYIFNNKNYLKNLYKSDIPKFILNRKKGPILVPIIETFKEQFTEIYRNYLTQESIKKYNFFNYNYLEKLFNNFEKEKNYTAANKIFAILTLQIWLQKFIG
jgi:asparagine synthase (glutamine-hydrolysing)